MKALNYFILACCCICSLEAGEVQFSDCSLSPVISTDISEVNGDELFACPRCRRAVPPGPRKRPVNL